jgi:DNA polymerase I-like protein with 3'-5' exonuclease and polymerase domains
VKILLLDAIDTELTDETMSICEDVLTEHGFPHDNVEYAHIRKKDQISGLPRADVVVCMGADAAKLLLPGLPPLKKSAGALTYSEDLETWVIPTMHPNCIYTPDGKGYGQFDIFYDHLRRAIDLCQGTLEFPQWPRPELNWEWVGHNGTRGYGGDPKVWSGYFESTPEEVARMRQILREWLRSLDAGEKVRFSIDTESYTTDHLLPMTMIQVYDPREDKSYAFNWGVIAKDKILWRRFLNHKNASWTLHNGKHDWKMFKQWLRVELDRWIDTMCYALGLTEKGNQTSLKYNSRQYHNAPFYEEGLEEWLDPDKDKVNYGHIRPDVLAEYGCYDVYEGHHLAEILPPLCEREGTTWLVENILLPAQYTFAEMEYIGIRVSMETANELKKQWEPLVADAIAEVQDYAHRAGFPYDDDIVKSQIVRRICDCVPAHSHESLMAMVNDGKIAWASLRKFLREGIGLDSPCDTCRKRRYVRDIDRTLNVSSSKQMQHLCFDVLGMEETYEGRKTNKYFWKLNPAHEFTKLVEGYRELAYLNKNIIDGFGRFVRSDGRVHPDFLLFGTVTGRLAVKNPAVQTIPKHSKNAKPVRKIFLPDEDCLILDVDYSNLELYMAHHLTGDENLLQGLQKDLHRTTAAAMYMKDYEEVSDAERQSAKPVNFGAGYNIGPGKLSRDINLIKITGGEKSKAQQFLDAFWDNYGVWNAARKRWINEAMENCRLTTEMGRVRRWNLITRDNIWKVENQACNFKGQSMASDLCLTSVIRLHKELKARGWGRPIMTVHDSIVFSIRKEFIHLAVPLIKEIMTTPIFETNTPFKVDVQIGPNYGEMSAYDEEVDYTSW